ncbi:ion channel [Citreimonas salinaria]|uniref:Ion channel n=1 Tax=Citreimonas salinaria TaxID=321339 RepID=A0A1H3KU95_9RHOB|nr:ion channel [Citreimonas salinaria]SDY55691.1 Ion channel [Citreimonas salinaria]
MLTALLIAAVFVLATIAQYYALRHTSRIVHPVQGSARAVTISVTTLSLGHLLQGGIYASGAWIGDQWLDLGGLKFSDPDKTATFLDHYYYSLVNLSTLGRGSTTPTGGLRLMTAVEAFHGFLLITSSGTYMFQVSAGKAPFARDG